MNDSDLQDVAHAVLEKAEKQGYVLQRDLRDALAEAGQPESRWRELVHLLRQSLQFRQGRYHFISEAGVKLQQEQHRLEEVHEALQFLVDRRPEAAERDRRREERVTCGIPVKLRTENGEESTVLCQDMSLSGIRFITNKGLIGQRVTVDLPQPEDGDAAVKLAVRILWTAGVGDELFENGGNFLEIVKDDQS